MLSKNKLAFLHAIDLFKNQTLMDFASYYHLDPFKTYIFEITGPYNKVIV